MVKVVSIIVTKIKEVVSNNNMVNSLRSKTLITITSILIIEANTTKETMIKETIISIKVLINPITTIEITRTTKATTPTKITRIITKIKDIITTIIKVMAEINTIRATRAMITTCDRVTITRVISSIRDRSLTKMLMNSNRIKMKNKMIINQRIFQKRTMIQNGSMINTIKCCKKTVATKQKW